MKSYIYKLSQILIAVLFFSNNLVAQNDSSKKSLVYWLHGINEEDLSIWKTYDEAFSSQFLMRGVRTRYQSNRSIKNLTDDVRASIDTTRQIILLDESVSSQLPIAICHDIGGLIVHSIEQENLKRNLPPKFRGIITVATPNQGSKFFEALKNGEVKKLVSKFFSDNSNTVLKGILPFLAVNKFYQVRSEQILRSTIVKNIKTKNLIPLPRPATFKNMRGDTAANFIGNIIGKALNFYLTNLYYDQNIVEDITPYSNYLTQLNGNQNITNVPIINLVGSSTDQSIYRFLFSTLNSPDEDPIDQHFDDGIVNAISELVTIYRTIASALIGISPTYQSLFSPQLVESVAEATTIGAEFTQAARALERDFPNGASMIVGSIVKEHEILGQKFVREVPSEDGIPIFRLVVDEKVIAKRIEGDDGILSETAQKGPNQTNSNILVVRNTNHIGVTNNIGTRTQLRTIFTDRLRPNFRVSLKP